MPKLIVARRGITTGIIGKAVRLLLASGLCVVGGCRSEAAPVARQTSVAIPSAISQPAAERRASNDSYSVRTRIGFRSRKNLDEHFAKHGREFRGLTRDQYLLAAQTLRDRPVGGNVEEIKRGDGTASRFDRASGSFLAFNRDGTIRTFFKPNDGERYFRRQAERSH
jgi:pyocin large subunit-like protein